MHLALQLVIILSSAVHIVQSLPAGDSPPTPVANVHINIFPTEQTDCGDPPAPVNGQVVLTEAGVTTEGATATQSCNAGYQLSGDGNIVCQPNGSWSDSASCASQASTPPAWSTDAETTSISEWAAIGGAVTLSATVLNNPDSIEILGTSTGTDATTLFSVSLSGANVNLVINGALDRETTAQFVLIIRARNAAGDTSTETNGDLELTVNVDDANDNDPVFSPASKCKKMAERVSGPMSVETLSATDADTAANGLGATPYSFVESQTKYSIAAATGEVTLKSGQSLSGGSYFLGIKATDQGSEPRTATGSLTVCVAPAWSADAEITSISEDVATGSAVTVTSTVLNRPNSIEILGSSTGTDATTLFSVSLSDGDVNLVTNGALDRETTTQFVLILNAKNSAGDTSTEAFGDLELTINVNDANDNNPVFNPTSKCKELADGVSGPLSVETLSATDADSASNGLGTTAYTFLVAQTNYNIAAATGEVTVKSGKTLATGSYILGIKATDQGAGPRTATGSLTVCVGMTCCSVGCCSITPELDAPAWSADAEATSISEDAAKGSAVTVSSTVLNTPTSIEILGTSIGSNATTLFGVSLSGASVNLVTKGALDRETTSQFLLILHAKNSAGTTSTEANGDLELTVNVIDVNDNDPVFSPASKCREVANGTSGPIDVETLSATDADSSANGLGTAAYTFEVAQAKYSIAAATGKVTLKSGQSLATGSFILGIKATDQGAGPRSATASLTICVEMVCCSTVCCIAPAWSADTETTSISEDAAVGTNVTISSTVFNNPTSIDIFGVLGANLGPDTMALFNVSLSGANVSMVTNGDLDREKTSRYVLILKARNAAGGTGTENNGDLKLTINVNDTNDNHPVFDPVSKCKAMANGTSGPTSIETLEATDADSPANGLGSMPYSFLGSQTDYDIVAATGEVTVKPGRTLYGKSDILVIVATDQGAVPRTGTGSVTVCVGMVCCQDGCCSRATAFYGKAVFTLIIIMNILSYHSR